MKIYLPGYYLRSLRNEPLIEIDAEDISTTIQVHQIESERLRTKRNLKVFEQISRSPRILSSKIQKKIVTTTPIEVPLVQEFIKNNNDSASELLPQTLNSIGKNDRLQEVVDSNSKSLESQTDSKSSSVNSSQQIYEALQGSHTLDYSLSVHTQTSFNQGGFTSSETHFPKAFKAKLKKNLRDSILKSPNFKTVRITNLSYSQPSTPKTPMYRSLLCGTPRVQRYTNMNSPSLSRYVPFTPMLHEAVKLLDSIPEKFEENVDLLNIIDDDTKPVEMVDKELDLYNEVNDANVVDYVLNMVNDYPFQEEKNSVHKSQKKNLDDKRKCQRAKPVFLEESEAFKEQKRQRDRERRQKRKQMFENKSPLGTRRSKRKLRPPPRI